MAYLFDNNLRFRCLVGWGSIISSLGLRFYNLCLLRPPGWWAWRSLFLSNRLFDSFDGLRKLLLLLRMGVLGQLLWQLVQLGSDWTHSILPWLGCWLPHRRWTTLRTFLRTYARLPNNYVSFLKYFC